MTIATSLLSGQATPSLMDRMRVLFDHEPIKDPYLVELLVESRSRKDISVRNDFESPPQPLVFTIDAPFCQALKVVDWGQLEETELLANRVEIGPCTIRKGLVIRVQFVTTGRPKITHNRPLLDIDIREESTPEPPHASLGTAAMAGGIIAIGSAMILNIISLNNHQALVRLLALVLGASVIFGPGVLLFRRRRRRTGRGSR